MEILTNKFKPNPNQMVASVYSGVAPGGRTVTTVVKPSADQNRMEATRIYGEGLPRGVGGLIGVLVLGGMVTTLAEMQYIVEARRQKKWEARRKPNEIVHMCRLVAERRNEDVRARRTMARVNPSAMPKQKRSVRLYLPTGCRFVQTSEPGLQVLQRG